MPQPPSLAAGPATGPAASSAARIAAASASVEAALAALALPSEPEGLYAPVRYVLDGGGKRLRPLLVLLAADAFGGETAARRAVPAALAVEVFHNFTLVHDDIMDRATERRGRPTVHVRWDEGTAILAGDLLMALSYDLLAQTTGADVGALVRRYHRMVVRLCEGQALDKAFETRRDVTVGAYLDMIERKTGALLEFVLEAGALVGGAEADAVARMTEAGRAFGRAFQIQDDLLDLTADDDGWGKRIGGDLVVGKRTFLLLAAQERAGEADRPWLDRALDGRLGWGEVPAAAERMERLGVLDAAREAVADEVGRGREALAALPAGPAADALRALTDGLVGRAR